MYYNFFNLRARQYDPSQSRFTGVDPLGRSTDTTHYNPYAYAQDNPLNFVDPASLATKQRVKIMQRVRKHASWLDSFSKWVI